MRFIRKFTEEQRVKIVEEVWECGSNSLIAAKYDLNYALLSKWKSCYRRYGQTMEPKEDKILEEPISDYKKRCKQLLKEKQELELEVAVLQDLLKKKNMS